VGGEFYVSLAYKPLLANGKKVAVYPLQHFMQWGTPEDVAEYRGWSAAFARLGQSRPVMPRAGSVLVPMAGLGQRFQAEGYALTKPLIPVCGQPMVVQATADLPAAEHHVFVLRADMTGHPQIKARLEQAFPGALTVTVAQVTEGQACTALIGLDALEIQLGVAAPGPITIGACDNGALYDPEQLKTLLSDESVDVVVWGARGHANAWRKPAMFGWIDSEGTRIRRISVKAPLSDPQHDPIVIGTFSFRRAEDFRRCIQRLIDREGRINGEFYLDACINDAIELGMNCQLFEVDAFLSWGTPNDLRTFEYWQSCFHKWPSHPYRLEQDARIPLDKQAELAKHYQPVLPPLPEITSLQAGSSC
jgi:hypothetical protein